jgi:hypothetical protein
VHALQRVPAGEGVEIGAHRDLRDAEEPAQLRHLGEAPLLDNRQDLFPACRGGRGQGEVCHPLIFDYLCFLVNHG